MRTGGLFGIVGRTVRGFCLATAPLFALTGCAAPSAYAGIPLAPGAADPEVQSIARRAQAGDKPAQLELGKRYEEGRGVPADRERARKLYRAAAASRQPVRQVYLPAVGRHGQGQVVRIDAGSGEAGLIEATRRLAALDSRASPRPAAAPVAASPGAPAGSTMQVLPWPVPTVYQAVLDNVDGPTRLDPESIRAFLARTAKSANPKIPAAGWSQPYSCRENWMDLPKEFLAPFCTGREWIRMHSYGPSPSGSGPGDPRRYGMTAAELKAQQFFLGDFLRSAPRRKLRVADLRTYPEFMESQRGAHLPDLSVTRLIPSRDGRALVAVHSMPPMTESDLGDEVISILVFTRE